METGELVVEETGSVRRLRLNRPKALNALTHWMCLGMSEALPRRSPVHAAAVVRIGHDGDRGVCAVGDIRTVSDDGGKVPGGQPFFSDEYRLNHLLAEYPKPIVLVMDGITMGG